MFKDQYAEENIEAIKMLVLQIIFAGIESCPYSDRGDFCKKYKVTNKINTLTNDFKAKDERYQVLKIEMSEVCNEKKIRRALLSDLQNVILTSHTEILVN